MSETSPAVPSETMTVTEERPAPPPTEPPPSRPAVEPVPRALRDDFGTVPPSRFRLPQTCSSDRKRARAAQLSEQQKRYSFVDDELPGHPTEGFRLPRYAASVPSGDAFSAPKLMAFLLAEAEARVNSWVAAFTAARPPYKDPLQYKSLLRYLPRPPLLENQWADPGQFAAQRLVGVNPLEIALYTELADEPLWRRAEEELTLSGWTAAEACRKELLFVTDYAALANENVQANATRRGVPLLVPTALFWAKPGGALEPLAIKLQDPQSGVTGIWTPHDTAPSWNYARFHTQVAHGAYHEGVRHLLETHLVSEVFAVCTNRQLHPDHPLYLLLAPHFQFTLAINSLARRDLLGPGGAIDLALSGGVGGALDAARVVWQTWNFWEHTPARELKNRGFAPSGGALEGQYFYRDDALEIWKVMKEYVTGILRLWYHSDENVAKDYELQCWAAEISNDAAGGVKGFPAEFHDLKLLCDAVTAIVFRASALHAAVNNGQYDTYGFVPNSPGYYRGPELKEMLRDGTGRGEATLDEVWAGLPDFKRAMAQSSMGWVLSNPTTHDLYAAGEVEAFSHASNPYARDVVARFRRALSTISHSIRRRNAGAARPYAFLDPQGIACSVET